RRSIQTVPRVAASPQLMHGLAVRLRKYLLSMVYPARWPSFDGPQYLGGVDSEARPRYRLHTHYRLVGCDTCPDWRALPRDWSHPRCRLGAWLRTDRHPLAN